MTHGLSPVHTSNCVECYKSNDSFDNVACCFDIVAVLATMLPVSATTSNKISSFRQSRNKLHMSICFDFVERTKFTIESFDIVAVCGNKVECCFDNVAGVNRA